MGTLKIPVTAASQLACWTCGRRQQTDARDTENIPLQVSSRLRPHTSLLFLWGSLSCGCPYHTSERRAQIIIEQKRNADRTEKGIFGIFGVVNTIKITNGKSQWGSLLWFSLQIESFSSSFFFFFFFLLFFFSLFCFATLRTLSSFLEAASIRVLSFWFTISYYLFIYY